MTGSGVVAVEPVTIAHSTGLLEAIRNVTDEPIKFLIHTHDHWDHSKGNGLFRDAGAKIVAHQDAATWMAANPHPDMVQPDTVWSGESHDLVVGNTTLRVGSVLTLCGSSPVLPLAPVHGTQPRAGDDHSAAASPEAGLCGRPCGAKKGSVQHCARFQHP